MIVQNYNLLGGANTNVSPFLMSDGSASVLNGCNPAYKLGALLKDVGYARKGAQIQADKSITGLFNFRQSYGTQKMLATVNDADGDDDTQLFYYTNVDTTVDVISASGQKVVSVTSTTGFIAGDTVIIAKGTANEETHVIDTIQVGVSITTTVNLANTHAVSVTVEQSWTELTAAEAAWNAYENMNIEMESFIGYCFIVGHSNVDGFLPVRSLTGTTFGTTNTTSMPGAKYITRYRDRLYIANCDITGTPYPYRVYFSSVPVAGAITWDPAGDFIDVDYSEQITGISENWDKLLIFTEYSAYMYNQQEFKKSWDVGCSNHRTIKNSGQYMFWTNRDGVWLSVGGGYPQNVSGGVIDFFRNGSPLDFFAEVIDEEYILYVGNVTVNGISYSNTELIFNIPTQTWRWRENYNQMTIFARYNESGKLRRYMGDTTGTVWDKGKYTDDTILSEDATINGSGQPIGSNFELAPITLGDTSFTKRIKEIFAFAERAGGLKLKYRLIDRNSRALTKYMEMGELTQYVNSFEVRADGGVLLQIAGTEYGSNPYWSFFGLALDIEEQSKLV